MFLVDYVPILQYADELVTILLLPYMVLGTIKRCTYIDKCIRNIIYLFVLIGLIGIASTVLNKVQPDKFAVCLDMLTLSKIGVIYFYNKCDAHIIYNYGCNNQNV